MKIVKVLRLSNGKEPFYEWLKKLDPTTKARIDSHVKKIASGGSKKSIRSLKDGVFEIKINFGPGYRIYFGEVENIILLILVGGDKRAQFVDIVTAKKYWREYVQKK